MSDYIEMKVLLFMGTATKINAFYAFEDPLTRLSKWKSKWFKFIVYFKWPKSGITVTSDPEFHKNENSIKWVKGENGIICHKKQLSPQ